MQKIFDYIESKKQKFAQLPLFDFMNDKSINPLQRLSFAPCMAHFIMSFSDWNKYVFLNEQLNDPIQKIVNQYAIEDSNHWVWFIKDLEQLGFNINSNFTNSLQFIWSEETKISRQLTYQIIGSVFQASPVIKLIAVEALEASADAFFSVSRSITSELQTITNQQYIFFGDVHFNAEANHTHNSPEAQKTILEIDLTDLQIAEAYKLVDKIFDIFSEWTHELLSYAKKHSCEIEISPELYKQAIYS